MNTISELTNYIEFQNEMNRLSKIKYQSYMKTMKEIAEDSNTTQISESAIYEDIIYKLSEAKDNGMPIDEGIFKSIFGGLAGATVGPSIMKAVCNVLGINERGALGNLMTSRMVLTAMGGYLGWKN